MRGGEVPEGLRPTRSQRNPERGDDGLAQERGLVFPKSTQQNAVLAAPVP